MWQQKRCHSSALPACHHPCHCHGDSGHLLTDAPHSTKCCTIDDIFDAKKLVNFLNTSSYCSTFQFNKSAPQVSTGTGNPQNQFPRKSNTPRDLKT